jgi:tripartite-type tricarboxylate transporter receptor subunit TctC
MKAFWIGIFWISGACQIAVAQGYPVKPIKFNYPFSAGSAADSAWRAITIEASKRLGQPIVFINKPGGNGRLVMDAVRNALPDGYTIGLATNGLALSMSLAAPPQQIDVIKQTSTVVVGIETPLIIAGKAGLPYSDFAGLIAYAKAHPGKVTAASAGVGSGSHIGIAVLANRAGIDLTHVPYKGSGPALQAVLAGEVDIDFSDPSIKSYFESGKLVPLAVTSERRWAEMPALQTVGEAGVIGANYSTYMYVFTGSEVPRDIVDRLNAVFNESLNTPEVKDKLERAGWIVRGGTVAQSTSLIAGELQKLRPIISDANIKFD